MQLIEKNTHKRGPMLWVVSEDLPDGNRVPCQDHGQPLAPRYTICPRSLAPFCVSCTVTAVQTTASATIRFRINQDALMEFICIYCIFILLDGWLMNKISLFLAIILKINTPRRYKQIQKCLAISYTSHVRRVSWVTIWYYNHDLPGVFSRIFLL